MVRIALAVALTAFILGGLKAYMAVRDRMTVAAQTIAAEEVTGDYRLELTLSFDAGPNEFSLNASEAPSLVVSLGPRDLVRRTDEVPAGAITVEHVQGLVIGRNEVFISASPRDDNPTLPRAVRVRIFQDGRILADQTLWSEPGQPVRGPVRFEIAAPHKHVAAS